MLIIISICILSSAALGAEEISLKEAIRYGLDNNLEIKEQHNTISRYERELKIIRAQQGWQIEISTKYNEVIDEPEQSTDITDEKSAENQILEEDNSSFSTSDSLGESNAEGVASSLDINRNFASGLSISQTTEIDDEGDSSYSIDLSYPIFEGSPTESERTYYEQEQELLQAENDYYSLIEDKISSWLEDYLQILMLQENRENSKKQLKIAEETLAENEKLYSESQLSESELNTTKADFIDAENDYKEANNQFENALESFKLALNIKDDLDINLENNDYLKELKAEIINYEDYDFQSMFKSLLQSDYDIKSNLVDLELQKIQLKWFQDEGKADINLTGRYDDSSETSMFGITFAYDLFDGGQRELNEDNLTEGLQLAEENLKNLKENKKLSLESQINKVKSAERTEKSEKLKLKNAENKFELAEEQYKSELITDKDLSREQLSYNQSKNSYQEALNELFIEELKLTMLLNNNFSEKIEVLKND